MEKQKRMWGKSTKELKAGVRFTTTTVRIALTFDRKQRTAKLAHRVRGGKGHAFGPSGLPGAEGIEVHLGEEPAGGAGGQLLDPRRGLPEALRVHPVP